MHIIKQYALVGHFVRYTLLVFCLVCLKDGLNSLYRPSEYSELIVTFRKPVWKELKDGYTVVDMVNNNTQGLCGA